MVSSNEIELMQRQPSGHPSDARGISSHQASPVCLWPPDPRIRGKGAGYGRQMRCISYSKEAPRSEGAGLNREAETSKGKVAIRGPRVKDNPAMEVNASES